MTLASVTYVSAVRVSPTETPAAVAAIVALAKRANAQVGITGTLLCTGAYFVQTLEGDNRAVAALLARISRDRRHDLIAVIENREIARRAYPAWAMGYTGTSAFIATLVERVIAATPPPPSAGVRRLTRFMKAFTQP